MKNRLEIIEDLKKNERAYLFLSFEEKAVLGTIINENIEYLRVLNHEFEEKIGREDLHHGTVYRIKADYTENKPKYLEFSVYSSEHSNGDRFYVNYKGQITRLNDCVNFVNFVGFRYEKIDDIKASPMMLEFISHDEFKRINPTHAVFLND